MYDNKMGAELEANAVAADLGEGWKPQVFNAADYDASLPDKWAWTVKKGSMVLVPPQKANPKYKAFFHSSRQFIGSGGKPHEAVAEAIELARRDYKQLKKDLKEMK